MDSYSSGEELVTKTRKPYTITKQRERWTDDEHTRFLEALKLYGRAWQRIEEHIGTKTAVQIRSHAQKFFTKLEKEALVKGLPTGQAIDIEIPPPRPKRKPNNPYPRKTSIGTLTSHAIIREGNHLISDCSIQVATNISDLDKEATPEKQSVDKQLDFVKEVQDQNNCANTLSFFQEDPSSPLCPELRNTVSKSTSTGKYKVKEFASNLKEVLDQDTENESCLTFKAGGGQKNKEHNTKQLVGDLHSSVCAKLGDYHSSHDKLLCKEKICEPNSPASFGLSSSNMIADVSKPRHVPVNIVNGSLGMSTSTAALDFSSDESLFHQTKVVGENVAAASTIEHQTNALQSSIHGFPTVHYPLSPAPSPQSDRQAFLHIPSTFTSLVAPALLENSAAHAAASFAARFLRVASVEPSAGPDVGTLGETFSKMMNSAPSLEELAAATVTAATAWWASQGLLPLCTSFNAGYNCSPAPMISTTIENGEGRVSNNEREVNPPVIAFIDQQLDPKCSKTLPQQQLGVEFPPLSASKSAEVESEKMNTMLHTVDPEQVKAVTKAQDSKNMKDQKLVDRSSCGSNTASSSDVETDALEKHDKKDLNEPDLSLLAGDSTNDHAKFCTSLNESWKEVSQGGRLAFQALFSRQVLPQSFASSNCHPKYNIGKDKQHINGEDNGRLQIDLNSKVHETCSSHKFLEHNVSLTSRDSEAEKMMTMGISYLKFKGRRTGFKPYKRCSAEAKESRLPCNTNQDEAKAPKRMRLEGCAYS